MEKKKIIGIGLIAGLVLVVILFIQIAMLNKKSENTDGIGLANTEENRATIKEMNQKLSRLTNNSRFYSINNLINRFLENVENNEATATFNVLDQEFIKQNSITEKNVLDKIGKIANVNRYETKEIYGNTEIPCTIYYAKGKIGNTDLYYIIVVDTKNNTYSIEPINEQLYTEYVNGKKVNSEKVEIEKNDDNGILFQNYTQEDIVQKYFNSYIQNVINYPQEVYNMLDEEYKNKKFGSFDNFKKYINNKADLLNLLNIYNRKSYSDFATSQEYEEYYLQFLDVGLTQYIVNTYTDYTEYICYDQDDNVYIFREKAPNDYTIILDAYTIEIPSVKQKYETSTDQDKVAMNIEKIKQAVNDKDYTYVYNKLDETFKNNNYPTEASFEQKMQSELYGRNDFSYTKVESKSNVYVCDVTVTDASVKNSTAQKILHVFMQLKDETDFVLSFNIE